MAYPSTFVDIQNAVIAVLRLDATADLAKVKDWINQAYAEVCLQTEAVQTSAAFTLTAGTASYVLSTLAPNVARIKQMISQLAGTSGYMAPVRMTSLQNILTMRQNSATSVTSGTVTHYALSGLNELEFFPTPAGADTLTIYYVALPTALNAGTDVPVIGEPFASKLLEYGALVKAADFVKDPFGYLAYQGDYDQWMMKFQTHLNRRRGGQSGQFEVVPAQGYPPHDPSTDIRGR